MPLLEQLADLLPLVQIRNLFSDDLANGATAAEQGGEDDGVVLSTANVSSARLHLPISAILTKATVIPPPVSGWRMLRESPTRTAPSGPRPCGDGGRYWFGITRSRRERSADDEASSAASNEGRSDGGSTGETCVAPGRLRHHVVILDVALPGT